MTEHIMTDRDPESKIERWRRRLRRLALSPVRYEVQGSPEPHDGERLCYVLETERAEDRWVLDDVCRKRGWPVPDIGFGPGSGCGLVTLWHGRHWFSRRSVPRDLGELSDCFEPGDAQEDVRFVPVAVFWGRAPGREQSWIKLWTSESWGIAGRVHRLLAVLVHGRDVLVKVGEPITVAALAAEDDEVTAPRLQRKLGRVMRVFFQQQRTATVGPDLSHRRLLLEEVLAHPLVGSAIRREVRANPRATEAKVKRRAVRYAQEIAADYSYPVVRMLDRALAWLWNRLYEGVEITHLDGLSEIPAGTEIVYVPCHRSHIDYMLLAYVIYRSGLAPPHTAAGVNLNIPLVGSVLRRGGAFFIRRSFQGDALYAAVFRGYFRTILARGFPVEYFVEGTRSRTGRLLTPKLGMLTMTAEAFLVDPARSIVFVPVYFGYEKLLEGQSFVGELRGQRKRKETLTGFLRSLKALRGRFGRVQVSFGAPIALADVLDRERPDWRDVSLEEPFRPEWLTRAVRSLGDRIMTSINEAAQINSVNLVSLVTLCMPKQAIVEVELKTQLDTYLDLARRMPYAERAGTGGRDATTMIRDCEELGVLARRPHALGDVLFMDERTAALASYHRNNVVHLFVLPALVAATFNNRYEVGAERIADLVARLYPCLRNELYLRSHEGTLDAEVARLVDAMVSMGLLERNGQRLTRSSAAGAQLRLCAQIVQPFLERYYLGVAMLLGQGSGTQGRRAFVARCSDAAEQLSLIYALNSPDLFYPELFENFVEYLQSEGLAREDDDGYLAFEADMLGALATALGGMLQAQLRRTLVNLAGLAVTYPSGRAAGA